MLEGEGAWAETIARLGDAFEDAHVGGQQGRMPRRTTENQGTHWAPASSSEASSDSTIHGKDHEPSEPNFAVADVPTHAPAHSLVEPIGDNAENQCEEASSDEDYSDDTDGGEDYCPFGKHNLRPRPRKTKSRETASQPSEIAMADQPPRNSPSSDRLPALPASVLETMG